MTVETATDNELLELAVSLAFSAGELLASRWSPTGPDAATLATVTSKSTRTDLVSAADRDSEALIVSHLLARRPHDAVLGEEHGGRAGVSGLTWVIDPLDGTINYLYGQPVFCVSIACIDAAGAIAGVVHNPVAGETFSACRGGGAFLNGTPLHVSEQDDLGQALIGTGFSYDSDRRRTQAQILNGVLPYVRDIRRGGAAALDLCSVAAGRLDGLYEAGLAPWDKAAGWLIVTEAGGTVCEIPVEVVGVDPLDTVVAASPLLAPALLDLVLTAAHNAA